MTARPETFIGSSSEGVIVANAVKANLASYTDCTVWHEDVFLPGQFYFEALEKALDRMDYAILVATPDDLLTKREVANFTMRDNVLLELGLFMAKLGRRRTYLMSPKDRPIHIPSDLLGVETVTYDLPPDAEASAGVAPALEKACATIEAAMRQAEQDLSLAVRRALARALLKWVAKVQGLVIAVQAESLKVVGDREEATR
ncbi:MAG: nucleotide-binding protein, partial [Gaiellales bacterium]